MHEQCGRPFAQEADAVSSGSGGRESDKDWKQALLGGHRLVDVSLEQTSFVHMKQCQVHP